MKHLVRTLALVLVLALSLNYRWVHAASAGLLAEACDPKVVNQAQVRVGELFGNVLSDPRIHCLHGPTLGLEISHGQTNFAPMLPSIVLIGPKGTNVDVLAHEWVHAETSQRLGFLQRSLELPTWIDEGLAMQADHRTDYSLGALARYKSQTDLGWPTPDDISSTNFYAAGNQGKLHYAISRCAVTTWLADNTHWLATLTTDISSTTEELTTYLNQCR